MASCGEVDHSVGMLPSGRKVGGEACQGSGSSSPALPVPECAICLQSCVHPVRLPCSHIFCFLCVKGASWQSKRCALCRQEIPEDFLERPTLLSPEELKAAGAGRGPGEYAWYYEGRNGWWQYDERTSRELEDAFAKGKRSTEMLIAGFLYVADLENMVQYRRNEHGRRRRMKRDVADIPKKGVAGLRLDPEAAAVAAIGAQGGAGRESSADGADTTPQAAGPTQAAAPPVRPPTSLGGQPTSPPTSLGGQPTSPSTPSPDAGTSLESSLARLQISHPAGRGRGRSGEDEEEGEATRSRGSSAPNTSVDESESGSSSLEEEEEEVEEEEDEQVEIDEEDEIDEEAEIQAEGAQVRQRLLRRERMRFREGSLDRSPPGGKTSSGSSSSVRSRRPDGQCTVTEV
ncbi:E3 ubiquitin-protein ligase rnf146 [Conger conger]|uniref:E3 ubiquitin-protein ligase rnf146 n=1 Tax=Conger conger TaxID=82655 RepID=UPI002A5A5262|nr:E3 ubiquitin-protein ligase rnf146 [Conger conger]XP_061100832.1 E3 ubiquitin-protein ligase rnf146 [Conger conger]XP_061100841.1 E3 ubiquitin-protein ligase rnf146 [Conger conger]XP_061100848.1 E3 ubiquitin-protein ligase rnf146 [Conger conger]XP_061100858.1 E3 ubiquitin-protein ligase rnf146 [Conger conger]